MLPEERFVTPPPSTPELQEPSSNIVNGLPTPRKTPLEPVVNEWRISLPDKPLNSFQDGIIPLDDFDKCKAAPEIRAYFCLIARYLNNANNANGLSSMPITDYEVTQGWTYLRDCHKKCKDLYGDDDKLRRELDIDGPTPDWQGLFVNPPTKDIASPLNGVEHATEPVDSVELLSRLSKGRELFMNSSLHYDGMWIENCTLQHLDGNKISELVKTNIYIPLCFPLSKLDNDPSRSPDSTLLKLAALAYARNLNPIHSCLDEPEQTMKDFVDRLECYVEMDFDLEHQQ